MNLRKKQPTTLLLSAVTAAAWWAQYFDDSVRWDVGDDSRTGGFAAAMVALSATEAPPVTPEQIAAFQAILARKLTDDLNSQVEWEAKRARWARRHRRDNSPGTPHVYLKVDYCAEGMLADAIKEAGIRSSSALPTSSSMRVELDEVSVSAGYQAGWENVPLLEGLTS